MLLADGCVSAIAVIDLVRELSQNSRIDADKLIAVVGEETFQQAQQLQAGEDISHCLTQRLPEDQLIGLWQLAESSGQPLLGFEIGKKVNPQAQGLLARWLKHCRTLGQAFETFQQHVALLNAAEQWQLLRADHQLIFRFQYVGNKRYPLLAQQRSLASLKSWAQYLTGCELPLLAVYLKQDKDSAVHQFIADYFNCPIHYRSSFNQLVIAAEQLETPLLEANDFVAGLFADKVTEQLTQKPITEKNLTINQKLWQLFEQDLSRFYQIDLAAAQLNMSRATLYRRLKQQGTSFSQILDQFRQQRWQQSEPEKYSATSLCEQLAFGDISSFYKAQKRWLERR